MRSALSTSATWLRKEASAALIAGLVITGAWVIAAALAPLLTPYDPIAVNVVKATLAPSADHLLGTDSVGRDIFARVLYGARIDLLMAVAGVIGPFLLGTLVGLLAGYSGGWLDGILMRILEVTISFPYFVLVIAIVAIIGPGLTGYLVSLTVVNWVTYARLVRSETLVLTNADFILAARVLGYRRRRIMLRHILPNAIVSSSVFLMTDAVLTVVLGSSLGFLGLGVQPPTPEWGVMIAEGRTYLGSAWWISLCPGIALCSLAFGLSLIADGVAHILDPEA
ncbi:MAG: ABC transporter permease [Mesorhizobium sp.]|uniref:ABC transporter permease n=1 Tax=Mesorhizobium sp. TaxID=1871066 RepID=UPI0012041575|nr:ABC transporter permease [Mesorhizobium sp.]TIW37460.1 MAG: ABC transporter permease [Mesorhizobium sp.]